MEKYEGPIEVGDVFTCPDNAGVLGYRRVRVLARHLDDPSTLLMEDLPSRLRPRPVGVFKCPELNLRIVFQPEPQ